MTQVSLLNEGYFYNIKCDIKFPERLNIFQIIVHKTLYFRKPITLIKIHFNNTLFYLIRGTVHKE